MTTWEEAYEMGFRIDSQKPSIVVQLGIEHLPRNSFILDMGSGNGRNSLYLANLGNEIDSVDVVDLEFLKNFPEMKNKIKFYKQSAEEFAIEKEKYNGIILARLIQYLNKNLLDNFISRCFSGLKPNGIIMISYNSKGGIKKEFGVDFYSHSLDFVKDVLSRNKFKTILIKNGANISTSVPYSHPIKSYDIIAKK